MGSAEPVFGKLKEVEILLSASTIPAAEIQLLPSIKARVVVMLIKVERRGEETGSLEWLHHM